MNPHDTKLGEPAELAALYAAGALTDAERDAFEAHLESGCAACAAEVRLYGPVTADLATALPQEAPPLRVRDSLLDRIRHAAVAAEGNSPLLPHLRAEARTDPGHPNPVVHRPTEGPWQDTAVAGVRLRVLHVDQARNHFTALVRMAPGTAYPRHVHSGPEECLVLEGDLRVGDAVMRAGDYQYADVGSAHGEQSTENGCLLFITSSLSDEFV